MCAQYAMEWGSLKAPKEQRSSFCRIDPEAVQHSKNVSFTIDAALQLNQPTRSAKRQGGRAQDCAVDPLPLPDIPSYASQAGPQNAAQGAGGLPMGRTRLANMLKRFACAKPKLGYNETIASLGAIILAVIGNERLAFQCLDEVYTRYRLDDYFVAPRSCASTGVSAVKADARRIYSMATTELPELVQPFVTHDCSDLLIDLAEQLLKTLLTQSYDSKKQQFPYFVRLMHRLIMPWGEHDPEDPRRQLRSVVLGIICRHRRSFVRCSSAHELREKCNDLRDFVVVDVPLLKMMDAPLPEDGNWIRAIHYITPAISCAIAAVASDVIGQMDLTLFGVSTFVACASTIVGAGSYLCTEPTAKWLDETAVLIRRSWRMEIEDVDDGEYSDGDD